MVTDQAITVLQLTDLHYMNGSEKDQDTLKLMYNLITWEQPDLIVVSGDTVYGPENACQIEAALKPSPTPASPGRSFSVTTMQRTANLKKPSSIS